MVTRRNFIKSSVVGSTITLGSIATTSSATASGASFGDGVNLQPAYFCGGEQDLGWDLMNQHSDISTVRIEIEPPSWGEAHSDLTLSDIRRWIDEANANGYQVIATCHHWPNNGSGDTQDLQDAANWWANNYATLSQNSDFIINVHNEWGSHDTTRSTFASAYNNAISTIRNNTSYTGPLVIDIPGYGQEYQVAADAAGDINDSNVILSGHIYPSAWNSDKGRWVNTSDLDYLDDNAGGYPCIVGEFGSNMDGQADWSGLVDHATSLGWPVLGWAWNGDGSSDPMNMTDPYWGNNCGATSYTKTSYWSTVYDKLGGSSSGGGGGSTSTHYLNAEYYSLNGTTTSTSRSGYWGDAYVTGFDSSGDSVTVSFDAAESGDRTLKLRYASEYDDKKANLSINGTSQGQVTLSQTSSFVETTLGTYSFSSGTNQITIEKGWGYYDIDAFVVE